MADPRPRQRRLLSLLPRILAEQPEHGTIGVLIGAMAAVLAELDEALERSLRDHWLGSASGQTPADEAMAVLERLGPYLGQVKNDGETREAYRLRLMRIDRVRVGIHGQTRSVLESDWITAVTTLVGDAKDRLAADLKGLGAAEEAGLRLALRDHWTRLAAGDPNLRNDAGAFDFPLPDDRRDMLSRVAGLWVTVLTRHWSPILQRHWTNLGRDQDALAAPADALSRLGRLFGIARLTRRYKASPNATESEIFEIREEIEAYRRRIQATAYVLGNGLTSPQALLELAIATLGAESCCRGTIERDALIVHGVPPGVAKRCPVCRSRSSAPCPNADQWVVTAWITDNPPEQRHFTPPVALRPGGKPFAIESPSLSTAIPTLRLKAPSDRGIHYPYLQNRETGEIMLYAGEIGPGQVLSLWPQVEQEEYEAFSSHAGVDAYPYSAGRAVIIDTGGRQTDVSERVCFLTGTRFPDPNDAPDGPHYAAPDAAEGVRFADALNQGETFGKAQFDQSRFGSSGQRVRMPRLRPGHDQWVYGGYSYNDVKAIVGNNPGDLLGKAPLTVEDVPAEVSLSWWVRPPALFRLTIPKSDWVVRAAERGALDQLARLVNSARAAGVSALIDFPEPPQREDRPLSDQVAVGTR